MFERSDLSLLLVTPTEFLLTFHYIFVSIDTKLADYSVEESDVLPILNEVALAKSHAEMVSYDKYTIAHFSYS